MGGASTHQDAGWTDLSLGSTPANQSLRYYDQHGTGNVDDLFFSMHAAVRNIIWSKLLVLPFIQQQLS